MRCSCRGPPFQLGEEAVAACTGLLKVAGFEGEAKALRERSLVDRELAPPRSIIVGEVVVGMGRPRLANETDGWSVGGGIAHDAGSILMEMHRSRSQAERKPPKRPRRISFSPFEPRIVPVGTGTLASPRQVAGSLHLADREPLLMLG